MTSAPAWMVRVASKAKAGGGHVSRCRALGLALGKRAPVVFVLDADGREWQPVLAQAGIEAVCEGEEPRGTWIGSVLDGYDFTDADAERQARLAPPLVVMDDFRNPLPHAHLVVNSAPGLAGTSLKGMPALLGPRYALLDQRFAAVDVRDAPGAVDHVVVATGRNDPKNATARILAGLSANLGQWKRCTVATGEKAARGDELARAVAELGARVQLLTAVHDMAALYASADVAIGAGGVSMLERMAAGTPSLTLILADNQRLSVEGAVSLGATISCGDWIEATKERISGEIARLIADRALRSRISERGRAAVDGRGAERVADVMTDLAATFGTSARREPRQNVV